jgi:acyl-homoserine-lactone acylase
MNPMRPQVTSNGPRGVELLWDRFGVAHVYAQDPEGLFFGFGYAQMQSHGNLVLKLYGESRGRAAEYWGPAYLENDRWVQTNEVPERSERWYSWQTPEFRRYLDAFASGMNTYAERHPEQLDPELRRTLPITGVDALGHMHRIVHFTYLSPASAVAAAVKEWKGGAGGGAGAPAASNAWAIAPGRTAAGKTLLLMNPHLPWVDWSIYYEIHLHAPGLNLYGATQVGFPVLRFVFSEVLGFTQTVNIIDGSDLYRLQPQDGGYAFDGAVHPFERIEKSLRIRQPDGSLREEPLTIRKSIHGPVVWDREGLVLAQRTVALDRPFMAEQYWRMATAGNFAEYQVQVARLQVPAFNFTYADREGHIMYLYNGTRPKRADSPWKLRAGILPGDTSATLWTEVHSYHDLPKVIDPPNGWVQNANDPPWSSTYPPVLDPKDHPPFRPGAGGMPTFRSLRSLRMLTDDAKFTFEKLLVDKGSTRLELADRMLLDLLAAVESHGTDLARRAASVLREWDRCAEAHSSGTLLFFAFARKFLGKDLNSWANFAIPFDPAQPLTTPRGLKDPAAAAAMLDVAAQETSQEYGSLDAAWGDHMRFRIGSTDLPANGAHGGLGAFRTMRFAPDAPGDKTAKAVFGDTFVACVEFGSPVRAEVLMSYGNSSQPGSPHREDQLPLLAAKELRPALRDRVQIEANLASIDHL